jgi:hypothetical protein
LEDLRSFDPLAVELSWRDRHWQLLAGGVMLKDFANRETDARQALHLIQDLRLTQRGTIGHPYPVMEYWLSNGQAPQGLAVGLRLLPLDTASLRVEAIQEQWCLRDDQRVLFNFGLRPEDARLALAVVQKYGFTHVGVIGQATPSLFVFLARPEERTGASLHPANSRSQRGALHDSPDDKSHPEKGPVRRPGAGMNTIVTAALPPLQNPSRERSPLGQVRPADFRHGQGHYEPSPAGLPGMERVEEWVPIDWRRAQLREEEGHWKLLIGGEVLADFGFHETDAQLALAAMHHYRFTEHCRLGRPAPRFSYFLVNGQPPRGLMLGVSGQAFQPEGVTVQRIGADWTLCEGNRVLVNFGEHAEEARHLLEVIQRYKFDRLCHVGPMTFFVQTH